MSNLLPFLRRAVREEQARHARSDAAAGAGAAFLTEETLRDYYGVDLTGMIAHLPGLEHARVETAERLRRAALRAIDHELGQICAERQL